MGYIYKITNLINNKIYIGQTIRDVQIRWKEHLRSKDEAPIHKAIRKYGKEAFKIEIIEECENILLNEREQYYINKFNSYNGHIGYNATLGGDSNKKIVDWVKSHPEEVKKHLDKIRPKAIQKFKENPELQEKREKARIEGYHKYIENNKEEWNKKQREKLEKARKVLQEQYKKDPTEIINRARENGKKASKPVYQLDKDTKQIIQQFESCSEAARFLHKDGASSNISKACKTGGTAYGYRWAYVNKT